MRIVEVSLKLLGNEVIDESADGLQQRRQVPERTVQASTVVLRYHRQLSATCRQPRHVLLERQVDGQVVIEWRQL